MSKNVSPTVDQAKAALSNVHGIVSELLASKESLLIKRKELLDAREALLCQPLSTAETLQAVCEIIDLRSQSYEQRLVDAELLEQWKFPVSRSQGNPRSQRHDFPLALCDLEQALDKPEPYRRPKECIEGRKPLANKGWDLPIGLFYGVFETGWQYFYLADAMKEKLCKLFGSEEGALLEDGKPNAKSLQERRETVEEISQNLRKIDEEIHKIEFDLEELAKPVVTSARTLRAEGATRL